MGFLFPIFEENAWQIGILAVTLAFILDLLFGDRKWLYGRLGHPIVWMGHLVAYLEKWLRNPKVDQNVQIKRGIYLVAIMVFFAVISGNVIEGLARLTNHGWIIVGAIGSIFFATRSLHDHVFKVIISLEQGLDQGRVAVGQIAARDTSELDESGISRAAIESLAENFSEGVIAPMFWFLLCGLPGLLAYKAINTLDSMIGHRSERYLYFGQFAARLADVANWPSARIAGLLLCLGALVTPNTSAGRALQVMRRDHGLHTSPNAGWPEGAMAGALDIVLTYPHVYGDAPVEGDWIGEGGKRQATRLDIRRGCTVYRGTCALIIFALVAAVLI